MTLATYGKSRRRVSLLGFLAILAILGALAVGVAGGDSGRYAFAQDGDDTPTEAADEATIEGEAGVEGDATIEVGAEVEGTVTIQGGGDDDDGDDDGDDGAVDGEIEGEGGGDAAIGGDDDEDDGDDDEGGALGGDDDEDEGDDDDEGANLGGDDDCEDEEGDRLNGEGDDDDKCLQVNLSSAVCVATGAEFHFNAPHAAEGAGDLTVTYTLNGGTATTVDFPETEDANGHPDWTVTLTGSGTFVITSATAGDLVWGKHGLEFATILCETQSQQFNVTVQKFIGGALATEGSFDLTSTWTAANLNGGVQTSGNFTLSSANSWAAVTSPMDTGYDYTVVETSVDATCQGQDVYRLVGYSLDGGTTQATPVAIDNGTANHTITVHNELCAAAEFPFNVVITKYLDGTVATVPFDLSITFDGVAETHGQISSPAGGEAFEITGTATSVNWAAGFDYSVTETGVDGDCTDPGDVYRLRGYSISDVSAAAAAGMAPSATIPAIVDGDSDFWIAVHNATCEEGPFTVTLGKFVGGQLPTGGDAFNMSATWTSDEGNGTGLFDLDADGFLGGPAYQAETMAMSLGFTYTASEVGVNGGPIDAVCDPGDEYALVGYSLSDVDLATAAALPPSATAPMITAAMADRDYFIAVHNRLCPEGPFNVVIGKFVDGAVPTSGTFDFLATFDFMAGGTPNTGSDVPFTIDADGFGTTNAPFQARTSDMDAGFEYSVEEAGFDAPDACGPNETLVFAGYSMSNVSLAAAAALEPSATVPTIVNGNDDYFIAVHNECAIVAGTSTVTIVKNAGDLPNSTAGFTVTGLAGLTSFTLDDDAGTGAVLSSVTIPGLSDDTFVITENVIAGWSLTGLVCTESGGAALTGIATTNLGNRTVSFDIGADAGLSITCIFTNQAARVGETPTVTPTTPVGGTATVTPTGGTATVTTTTSPATATTTTTTTTDQTNVAGATPITTTAGGVTGGVTGGSAVAGATPIAPSTGSGTSAAERTATLGLFLAGLVAMTAGATLFTIRRRS